MIYAIIEVARNLFSQPTNPWARYIKCLKVQLIFGFSFNFKTKLIPPSGLNLTECQQQEGFYFHP